MHKCSKCGLSKEASQFRPRGDVQHGLRKQCKTCMNRAETEAKARRELARLVE